MQTSALLKNNILSYLDPTMRRIAVQNVAITSLGR
jgi:hypothetical protein